MKEIVLIIDDNKKIFESLKINFEEAGFAAEYAANKAEAINSILTKKICTVLLDIMLGEENGIDILKDINSLNNNLPIIMITGYASIDTAVQAMKNGAFDYVKKPLDFNILLKIVENAKSMYLLKKENETLKTRLKEHVPFIFLKTSAIKTITEKVLKIAHTDLTVLITGENGTGKEILADFIHMNSPRALKKIEKINCAAFSENLLENELFGHEKGSFTGAVSQHKGIFERADGGTLFLDEIGDMPQTIQAKILRALQNMEIRRIGGNEIINIDVRFIAATNKNIESLIEQNLFRQDLYYRLNTATVNLPPLRESKDDIIPLANYFASEYAKNIGKKITSFDDSVLSLFTEHPWQGNIRELKNTVNYASAVAIDETIHIEDLPPNFSSNINTTNLNNIREELELSLILRTLKKYDNNKSKTAKYLKMGRNTLYQKLEKYGYR